MKDFILSLHTWLINIICLWSPVTTATIDNLYNNGKEIHFKANYTSFLGLLWTEEWMMLLTVSTFICFYIFIHFTAKRALPSMKFQLFFLN